MSLFATPGTLVRAFGIICAMALSAGCGGGNVIDASLESTGATQPAGTGQIPSGDVPTGPDDTSTINKGIVQGGKGWLGDVNVAATSADYLGLTLDQIEASGSDMGNLLKQTPKVEQAIRLVSAETGVPSGLLAGVCYQESSFDVNAVSNNPNPTEIDSRDVGITQAPYEDFKDDSWKDPATNLRDFIDKQHFLSGYKEHKSWGYMLRMWNTGEVLDVNDLSKQRNNTDAKYLTEILGTHCLGKD